MAGIESGNERWDTSQGFDDDELEFIVEGGIPSFTQRLTRRQKLVRGGVAVLVVVSAAFFLLGGPAATTSLIASLHESAAAAPVPMARVDPISSVRLPPGSVTIATLQVSPAAGSAGGAYACWVTPSVAATGSATGTLHVTSLAADSQPWRPLDPPVAKAVRCGIEADAVNPQQALMSVYTQFGSSATCSLPDLYFTGDGGATWTPVHWPDTQPLACAVRLDLVGGHVYLMSADFQTPLVSLPDGSGGRLFVSSDLGLSWRAGDAGTGDTADFQVLGIRPGGHLLAQTSNRRQPDIATLWESRDDGMSWQSLGKLPGAHAQVFVSQNPVDTAHGGWGKLYLSAQSLTNGVAGGAGHAFFATAYPGSGWRVIAALPTSPDDTGPEPTDIAGTGVGPNEALYVMRSMTSSNGHAFIPQRSLWIWDGQQGRWLLSPVAIPENTLLQGISWSGSAMRLWMTIIHEGIPPTVQIAALTLRPQPSR